MKMILGKVPFDIDFHPSNNLFATALINGDLHLYRFSLDDSVPVRQLEVHAHADSKRAARFIDCERVLFTASSDCSVLATDVETRSTITHIDNVHEATVNRLINLTQSTVVSPDDVGFIKIWDIRKRSCYNYFNAHENYISDMTFASDAMKLLTTSEDKTLSVCNLRTNSVQSRSEMSGLLSVVLMKNGRKFVCRLQNGIILYSWGCFKNFSDAGLSMYMNNSIDTMLKLDENIIITGGSDNGIINLLLLVPSILILLPIPSQVLVPQLTMKLTRIKRVQGCCRTLVKG
ncbi:WD repeat-containing protein 55-like [Phaseolus vulgaris]|uniref:WD repeat-containing protein 55-like n=1 Tax=Phaseolus vulgaris TaxID=3885 RepID=UPI0035C9F439